MATGGRLIRIEHESDPRIAEFVAIRERDLVGRGSRFIAEGTVVVQALAEVGATDRFRIDKLFLLENRVDGLRPLLDRLDPAIPVYVADRAVMDAVVGFAMHRGVLAVGVRAGEAAFADFAGLLPERALVAVCCGIANHDNMGSIFRNAGVFGADAVFLDRASCDPLYRKAIRVSVGAVFRVPYCRGGDAGPLLEDLAAAGFDLVGLSPRGETRIEDCRPSRRTALVVGTEGPGLAETVLARVQRVRIAQAPGLDSLNVATATGIALWHFASRTGRLA